MQSTEPRSVYDHPGGRRFTARDAVLVVVLTALLLVLLQGPSIRRTGEEMEPGFFRTMVLAVGKPAGWAGDRLPLDDARADLTAFLSPDEDLGNAPGFDAPGANAPVGVPPMTPDWFDARDLGDPGQRRPLRKLLITGDSLAMPLDTEVARRLSKGDVETIRDAHVGTGISKSTLLDWGKLSVQQVRRDTPDAVVVFIGANEGFPMPAPGGREAKCCGPEWASIYAARARRMMVTYRRRGAARVYWLTLPAPRDGERARIARSVNAALTAAAAPYRSQVRLLDMGAVFSPGGRYRDAMDVDGRETIVRESDGVHLNETGARVAADVLLRDVGRDFSW